MCNLHFPLFEIFLDVSELPVYFEIALKLCSSKPGDQDVTQSPTYRIIHGLEPEKQTPQRSAPQGMVASSEECMRNATVSPVFGMTNKPPTRQGLSFMILQCLYEDEPAKATLPETADQDAGVTHHSTSSPKEPLSLQNSAEDQRQSNRKVAINSNGIVGTWIIAFLLSFGLFLFSIIINSSRFYTLPITSHSTK